MQEWHWSSHLAFCNKVIRRISQSLKLMLPTASWPAGLHCYPSTTHKDIWLGLFLMQAGPQRGRGSEEFSHRCSPSLLCLRSVCRPAPPVCSCEVHWAALDRDQKTKTAFKHVCLAQLAVIKHSGKHNQPFSCFVLTVVPVILMQPSSHFTSGSIFIEFFFCFTCVKKPSAHLYREVFIYCAGRVMWFLSPRVLVFILFSIYGFRSGLTMNET